MVHGTVYTGKPYRLGISGDFVAVYSRLLIHLHWQYSAVQGIGECLRSTVIHNQYTINIDPANLNNLTPCVRVAIVKAPVSYTHLTLPTKRIV